MVIMATGTFGNNFGFVALPIVEGMDVVMTVGTGNFILLVDILVMLAGFFFMAAHTFWCLRHDVT
jgi:uncharacterized membrane protein YqaE (UPF0057 family)